jgi:hypothetical protein
MAQMFAEVSCKYQTAHQSVMRGSGLFSLLPTSAMYRIMKFHTTIWN